MPNRKSITIANELVGAVETASAKLRLLQETEVTLKPAPGKWSKKEILGHLMDSASNNHQRFVRAQMTENPESLHSLDTIRTNGFAGRITIRSHGLNWLNSGDCINRHVAHALRNIPDEKLETICRIGTDEPVTLGFIAEDYLAHMKHHLAQLGVTNV